MLKKFAFYLSIVIFLGCGSGSTNKNNASTKKDSVMITDTANRPQLITTKTNEHTIDDSARKADSIALIDPDTIFSHYAVEMIEKFPEVVLTGKLIDSASNHKENIEVDIMGMPAKDEPYYLIVVGHVTLYGDSDGRFFTLMNFHVYKQNKRPLIKFYDIDKDTELSLKTWRAEENTAKKKRNRY